MRKHIYHSIHLCNAFSTATSPPPPLSSSSLHRLLQISLYHNSTNPKGILITSRITETYNNNLLQSSPTHRSPTMSIFQNALAMGSRLNLGNMNSNNNSSSSSSSPKTKSSSSGGKFLSRNMSTKSSKVQNMKQSQSQSQSPMIGSPLSVSSAAAVTPKGSPARE